MPGCGSPEEKGGDEIDLLILLVAGLVLATVLINMGLARTAMPPLVGYLLLGTCLRLVDHSFGFMEENVHGVLNFLAQIGLFALLFRVGLESKLDKLLGQLKEASILWAANIVLTFALTYFPSRFILGLEIIPSLILSTALTATSVGVTVVLWQERGALDSKVGSLLVDLAELDDISGVLFMALLFAVLPVLHSGTGGNGSLWGLVLSTMGWLVLKLALFLTLCVLFSKYLECPLASWFRRLAAPPEPMLMITGLSLMVSALAGILGFSLAVGAFFAGLVFSRDPETVKMETSFIPLHDFFAPFFFIGLGFDIAPTGLGGALWLGLGLAFFAVVSKVLANGLPMLPNYSASEAAIVGVSMVPRAEIAMVIVQQGRNLGEWAIPSEVYGAMVIVSLISCILTPPVLRAMLKRWPPGG